MLRMSLSRNKTFRVVELGMGRLDRHRAQYECGFELQMLLGTAVQPLQEHANYNTNTMHCGFGAEMFFFGKCCCQLYILSSTGQHTPVTSTSPHRTPPIRQRAMQQSPMESQRTKESCFPQQVRFWGMICSFRRLERSCGRCNKNDTHAEGFRGLWVTLLHNKIAQRLFMYLSQQYIMSM